MPWKSRPFQLSCAARSVSTFFALIWVPPFSGMVSHGRVARSPARPCVKFAAKSSGSFRCIHLVGGRAVNVERANHGFGLEEMPQGVVDLLVLLAVILLGILPCVPKAESQNLIALRVRDEHNLVDEAALLFQNRHCFFIDSVGEFFRLAGLAGQFNYAGEHRCAPFVGSRVKGTRRCRDDGSTYSLGTLRYAP